MFFCFRTFKCFHSCKKYSVQLRQVKCLHLKSMRLTSDLPKLNQGRFGHQTAVFDRDLYVVGGSPDKFEGLELNTAEKY